jgi:hypothetical protein
MTDSRLPGLYLEYILELLEENSMLPGYLQYLRTEIAEERERKPDALYPFFKSESDAELAWRTFHIIRGWNYRPMPRPWRPKDWHHASDGGVDLV